MGYTEGMAENEPKRRGRPPVDPGLRRDHHLGLRVTAGDVAALSGIVAPRQRSAWLYAVIQRAIKRAHKSTDS